MTNIWGFILQTVEVSLIALLILILKRLFKDKLSPRWQYGIWFLLFLALIKPTGYMNSYIIPYIQVVIEAIKSYVEYFIQSSYSSSFVVTYNTLFVPYIKTLPHSITDMIFVIYAICVYGYIGKYFIDYFKFKSILKFGHEPDEFIMNQINRVSEVYHLNKCKVIQIDGLSSAFVFGIFKPVLVLPNNVDDKVILHELLHLKHFDLLHNVVWALFKAIHFCNPVMNYVFTLIHNDMETLCDYRVLELLHGEERREYGRILLSMVNEKYPSVFGTTSISNGAIFIKERIEAITRFKKYPKGVSLVSICIGVLIIPMISNNVVNAKYIEKGYLYDHSSFLYHLSTSSAKLVKCTSIAGAIDTYAKGLYTNNDLYLISVMPKELINEHMSELLANKPKGMKSSGVSHTFGNSAYEVYNLIEVGKNKYHAELLFGNHYEELRKTNDNEVLEYVSEIWVIPIEITKENGWKVRQIADMKYGKFDRKLGQYVSMLEMTYNQSIHEYNYQNEYGELNLELITRCYVNDENINGNNIYDMFNEKNFSLIPNVNAEFAQMNIMFNGFYKYNEEHKPYSKIGIATTTISHLDNNGDFDFIPNHPNKISGSDGSYACIEEIGLVTNNCMDISTITSIHGEDVCSFIKKPYTHLHIYHDNEVVLDLKMDLERGEIYDK